MSDGLTGSPVLGVINASSCAEHGVADNVRSPVGRRVLNRSGGCVSGFGIAIGVVFLPATNDGVLYPATNDGVFYPATNDGIFYPATTSKVFFPATNCGVFYLSLIHI